jgi:hypothetical protein
MSFIRRRAFWLAASMLLVQLAASAASAATAICCKRAAATTAKVMDCCKGEGHSCPLMKVRQSSSRESGAAMKSCPGGDERIASLLFGARGVLLVRTSSAVAPRVVALLENAHLGATSRAAIVETPPPRA